LICKKGRKEKGTTSNLLERATGRQGDRKNDIKRKEKTIVMLFWSMLIEARDANDDEQDCDTAFSCQPTMSL